MNNGELCSNEHSKKKIDFFRVIWPPTWQPSWNCTYIFSNFPRSFLGVINWSISMKFHTQLEHTILKCVTGQHLLFTKTIFLNNFFYCACIFQAGIIDGTLCTSHIATLLYWISLKCFCYSLQNTINLCYVKFQGCMSRNAWEKFRGK